MVFSMVMHLPASPSLGVWVGLKSLARVMPLSLSVLVCVPLFAAHSLDRDIYYPIRGHKHISFLFVVYGNEVVSLDLGLLLGSIPMLNLLFLLLVTLFSFIELMLTEQKKKLCYLLYPKIQAQMVSELEAKTRLLSDLALISITQMYIEEHLAAKKQNKKKQRIFGE